MAVAPNKKRSEPVKPFAVRSLPIGAGVISTAPHALVNTALKVPPDDSPDWIVTPYESVRASLALVSQRNTLIRQLKVDGGGSVLYNGIDFGFDSGYTKTVRTVSYALTFAISIVVVSGFRRLKQYELTDEAKRLFDASPEQFARSYGDMFCGEQAFGGTLCAIGTYATGSQRDHYDVSTSIDANTIAFGAWADARLGVTRIHAKEKFDIAIYTEGAFKELPKKKHLASPDAFLKWCDEWIALARANSKKPVQHLLGRYTSLPYIGNRGVEANVSDLIKLDAARDEALYALESIGLIRSDRDNYEKFPEDGLRSATDYTRNFIASCDDRIAAVREAPFGTIEVPAFTAPPLPNLSRYSMDAIFSHLASGGYAEVVLKTDVALAKGKIEAGKVYKVFWKLVGKGNPRWYCRAPDGAYTPVDVTTKKTCTRGWLYMWGHLFSYDNHGTLIHYTQPVAGSIELTSEF